LIKLPKVQSVNGNITSINNNLEIPFEIKRTYYLYDVPSGEARGGHAHRKLEQLIVAVSGSFDIIIDDGINRHKYNLNRPDIGLYIVPGIWRDIENFSSGSVLLVLASAKYEEQDYIRNYDELLKWHNDK
jgi:dTDP-4-dehydrorhamnose 3,5-epimerase-like enzyme